MQGDHGDGRMPRTRRVNALARVPDGNVLSHIPPFPFPNLLQGGRARGWGESRTARFDRGFGPGVQQIATAGIMQLTLTMGFVQR